MQFLGYRHVIATMWTIADSPAPDVVDGVYATLSANGTPEAEQTARALHQAVRDLREQDPTNPLLWAPYTHIGPDPAHAVPVVEALPETLTVSAGAHPKGYRPQASPTSVASERRVVSWPACSQPKRSGQAATSTLWRPPSTRT